MNHLMSTTAHVTPPAPLAAPPGSTGEPPLGPDLLRGAEEIAEFVFGSREPPYVRRIYHLVEKTKLPCFRLGSLVCARRSVLMAWIRAQARRAM